jgi:hypothetical protein
MNARALLDYAEEYGENLIMLTGFDDAVVGIGHHWAPADGGGASREDALVYDFHKMVKILMERDGMTYIDAVEYLEFNAVGGFFGPSTPIYVNLHNELGTELPEDPEDEEI